MQKKEFGRYTPDQLIGLSKGLGQLRALEVEVLTEFQANPERLRSLLTPQFYWAALYERPFLEMLAMLTVATGMSEEVMAMTLLPDPQEAALHSIDECVENSPSPEFNFSHVLTLLYAVTKSKESLMTYDLYLDELITKVRNGNDQALFKAVRIDRSVIAAPTVADRIAFAEIEGDQAFFKKLGKSFSAGPPKQAADYPDLRYLLAALDAEGVLDKLTQKDEFHIFAEQLRVYPPDGEDAERSLHQFIYRWKKSRRST